MTCTDHVESADRPDTMREELLAAGVDGRLLEHLSTIRYDALDRVAKTLAAAHNSDDLDVLAHFGAEPLEDPEPQTVRKIAQVFRLMLPLIQCTVAEGLESVGHVNRRLRDAGLDDTAHYALSEWLRAVEGRAGEALSLVLDDTDVDAGLLQATLVAGDAANAKEFTIKALELSDRPQAAIREAALFAIGQIVPLDDAAVTARTVERLRKAFDASASDGDAEAAIEASFDLFRRAPDRLAPDVESIMATADRKESPSVRRGLALGLFRHRRAFTADMIDLAFSALRHTKNVEHDTVDTIDSVLYEWDLDADRDRVCTLLQSLLTHAENPLSISHLDNLQHRLSEADGQLLGWYVLSLLSSADDRLCRAAAELLPYKEQRVGIDIDLSGALPTSTWVPFLARKVLGYCLFKRECAAGLLLACLREVHEGDRDELEELIFEYFLLNYLHAIEFLEAAVAPGDPAEVSVRRLSERLASYVTALEGLGTCAAFEPSERERYLRAYRERDFWEEARRKAEEGSIFFSLVGHKTVLLYGSAARRPRKGRRREYPASGNGVYGVRAHCGVASPRHDRPGGAAVRSAPVQSGASSLMKLILMEYLGSLRERGELDVIMPDLLSELGMNVLSKPGIGTRQYGVDVAAIGEEQGVPSLFLLSIKRGNLRRSDWNTGEQALRPSLIEILEIYIPTHVPPRYADYPVVVVPCIGGDVVENVGLDVKQFMQEHETERVRFQLWNGGDLADRLLSGVLRENTLPSSWRSDFRKCLAMIDEAPRQLRALLPLGDQHRHAVQAHPTGSPAGCAANPHRPLDALRLVATGREHRVGVPLLRAGDSHLLGSREGLPWWEVKARAAAACSHRTRDLATSDDRG